MVFSGGRQRPGTLSGGVMRAFAFCLRARSACDLGCCDVLVSEPQCELRATA